MKREEFDKAFYGIIKLTRVCDYKEKVKPFIIKAETYLDRECNWHYEDDFYKAECGFTFCFSDERDEVTDYGFLHCPKCGGKLNEKPTNSRY